MAVRKIMGTKQGQRKKKQFQENRFSVGTYFAPKPPNSLGRMEDPSSYTTVPSL